jgi:hypothetical protein
MPDLQACRHSQVDRFQKHPDTIILQKKSSLSWRWKLIRLLGRLNRGPRLLLRRTAYLTRAARCAVQGPQSADRLSRRESVVR